MSRLQKMVKSLVEPIFNRIFASQILITITNKLEPIRLWTKKEFILSVMVRLRARPT